LKPVEATAPVAVALGGMLALASAMGIGRFVYTPILPSMLAALGFSKSQAGLIAAANFAGYLVGALSLAACRRLPGGSWRWLAGALAAGAALIAAMAAVEGAGAFAVLRFASGVASAVVLVLGSTMVLEQLARTDRGGRFAALHFAGVGVGIVLSALVVPVSEAAGAGWRVLWLTSGAVAAALAAGAAFLLRGVRPQPHPVTQSAATPPPARSALAALTLCHGLFGFGYVVTATFLVAVVRATPQARPVEALVWLMVGLAAIPSTAFWSRMAVALGATRAYGLACAVEAVGVAAGGLWPGRLGVLLAAALLGATIMGITTLGFTLVRGLVAPTHERRAFALITAGFGVGQMAGPIMAGILLDRTGGFAIPSLVAAGALGVAALIAASGATHRARS
jgi:MFS family permease